MISIDVNSNSEKDIMNDLDMEPMDGEIGDSNELLRLKEKVKALEKQNAILKHKDGDDVDGAVATPVGDEKIIEEIQLIEIEDLDESEGNWLLNVSDESVDAEDECSWLRKDVMSPNTLKKKSLVNKLDDIAKRSPVHTGYGGYGGSHLNGSYRVNPNSSITMSPYKSFTTSPPSAKYAAPPSRGQNFDPRTFTRSPAHRGGGGGAYSLPPEDDVEKVRKSSYHRLNFGAKSKEENLLNTTYDTEDIGNNTYTSSDKLSSTFNKTSEIIIDNNVHCNNQLNTTYDRNISLIKEGLNSTFTRSGDKPSGILNATFEKEGPVNGIANHRKMSEDRLSSASSSCDVSNRLSRESSQDILVEDLDRLSTTSAMSESSVSHRLNDVQDVQDIARMQEESLKHSTPLKNQRSDTISPLSEHSLSSPVEDGGGYQSEESCGSESGMVRNGPRRGDTHHRLQVYSSQDSLPDSPYSSQSLDSHTSHGNEVRRSMPNLNKLRGGKVGTGAGGVATRPGGTGGPQYGLSQSKYHNSESRLQQPPRMQAPMRGLRAPTATSGLARPTPASGLRPPGDRKQSGIARPQGLPRPASRLQQPGSYMRSGLPMRGAPGGGRAPTGGRSTAENKNWIEDCY